MGTRPRISVVIPCFNLGQYLDEAVDSVFAQTIQDFEILIVDDGSTDPFTRQLLAGYRRPRTRVFVTENRGLAAARNLAIANSEGEFLCALDPDDRLRPRFFEKALRVLDQNPELTFVSAWLQMFGIENGVWKQDACDLATLLDEDTVMTAAVVRLAAVRELGGYDSQMGAQGDEDWDLWIGLAARGHRGQILPEVLFDYRRRPGSMGEVCTQTDVHLKLLRYIVQKHRVSYLSHLDEVLERKDRTAAQLENASLASIARVTTWLRPTLELKVAEVARLKRKTDQLRASLEREAGLADDAKTLAALRQHTAALEQQLDHARHRVDALTGSLSWKVTSPLRAAFDWVKKRPPG